MHKEFWLERWKNRQIGFDQPEPNSLLVEQFNQLNLSRGSKIFVPLTGKSVDVLWLISKGYSVIGCELSKKATTELFDLLSISPNIKGWQYGCRFETEQLTMFVGDFFDLLPSDLGEIDAVYDRASLVALPSNTRKNYTNHLRDITQNAPQLLIVFDYDQNLVSGPPFSVNDLEINMHYAEHFTVTHLQEKPFSIGIKGIAPATENAWLIK